MAQTIKIGINGFGRIGRKIARLALTDDSVEIVGINDLSKPESIALLFKYDSVHGSIKEDVRIDGNVLIVGRRKIQLFSEKDPAQIPWGKLGAELVHECTGIFTDKEKAAVHLKGGAKRVIISAPSKDADITLCMGVNETAYDPSKHFIVSNASCTTNCLAPMVKVLDDHFVVRGTMLTVHSYTNDQQLLDLPHKDPRRARAAALSQIPTTTGAAKAVGLVLPHLKGKLDGLSIRVPTPNVSLVDFTGELKKSTTKEEINAAFKKAADSGPMKGYLAYSDEPLVSHDYNGNIASSTIDSELTTCLEGNFVKVISWYDNESGFSARMLDLSRLMASKGI
jgi:glyceraldehyde 3-phosphate dehydrogenase